MRGSSVLTMLVVAIAIHVMWWLYPWDRGAEWVCGFGAGCAYSVFLTWRRDRKRVDRLAAAEGALSLAREKYVRAQVDISGYRRDLAEMGRSNQRLRRDLEVANDAVERGRRMTTHLE